MMTEEMFWSHTEVPMDQAEKLREIVKKQSEGKGANSRIITVTSGKGGVGKSSLSINLALQFRRQGKKVIIFDADFGLANIEVMFGVIPKYTLADLMFRGKELKEVITEGPEGVMFVSGGSGIARLVNLDNEQIKRLVNKMSELEEMADVVIIDTGAGISPAVLEFVAASSEVILVTTPEPTSITDSYALLKALSLNKNYTKDKNRIMLVTNKVRSENESRSVYEKLSAVVEKFLDIDISYLGAIPSDESITKAVMSQTPVSIAYPSSPPARAFKRIGDELLQSGQERTDDKRGLASLFTKLFGTRKRT